ncbi:MAG: PDZ domain-containing protein [Thermoanaerobaculaceae bacterium]|jgi:S1-C subfamily serine protease|nr:PDZ domain-containing protein [Thermoanaerobaculaceae bacterium]
MRGRQVVIFVAIVVGLVASIVASLVTGVEGCATPTDECVRAMVARLRTQAWLGIETDGTNAFTGTITAVVPGSPADTAGLAVGDVLMTLDGLDLGQASPDELARVTARLRPGSEVALTLAHAGRRVALSARLTAPPGDEVARLVGEHVITTHARVALPGR